jgi:predicted nucleic acid-binding protein
MPQHASENCAMNGTNSVPVLNVYLDANVFIEMWENRQTEASRLIWRMFSISMRRDWCFVSSELSLTEVLVDPIASAKKSNDWTLVDLYRFQIFDKEPFQRIAPVTREVLDMAANVRSENSGIKTPDAIHVATALIHSCSALVSNDRRLVSALSRDLSPKPFLKVLAFPDLLDVDGIG